MAGREKVAGPGNCRGKEEVEGNWEENEEGGLLRWMRRSGDEREMYRVESESDLADRDEKHVKLIRELAGSVERELHHAVPQEGRKYVAGQRGWVGALEGESSDGIERRRIGGPKIEEYDNEGEKQGRKQHSEGPLKGEGENSDDNEEAGNEETNEIGKCGIMSYFGGEQNDNDNEKCSEDPIGGDPGNGEEVGTAGMRLLERLKAEGRGFGVVQRERRMEREECLYGKGAMHLNEKVAVEEMVNEGEINNASEERLWEDFESGECIGEWDSETNTGVQEEKQKFFGDWTEKCKKKNVAVDLNKDEYMRLLGVWHGNKDGEVQEEQGNGKFAEGIETEDAEEDLYEEKDVKAIGDWHGEMVPEMNEEQENGEEMAEEDFETEGVEDDLSEDREIVVIRDLHRGIDVEIQEQEKREVGEENLLKGKGVKLIGEWHRVNDGKMLEEQENGELVEVVEIEDAQTAFFKEKDVMGIGEWRRDTDEETQEEGKENVELVTDVEIEDAQEELDEEKEETVPGERYHEIYGNMQGGMEGGVEAGAVNDIDREGENLDEAEDLEEAVEWDGDKDEETQEEKEENAEMVSDIETEVVEEELDEGKEETALGGWYHEIDGDMQEEQANGELVEDLKTEDAEEDLDAEVEVMGDWHRGKDLEMKEEMKNGEETVEEFGTEVLEDDLGENKYIVVIRDLNEEMDGGIEEEEMEKGEVVEDYESEDPGEALFKEKDDMGLEEWHRVTDGEIHKDKQEYEEEMVADMELEDAEEDLDEDKVGEVIGEWHRRSDMEIQGEQDDGEMVNNLEGTEKDLEEDNGEEFIDGWHREMDGEMREEEQENAEVVTDIETEDAEEELDEGKAVLLIGEWRGGEMQEGRENGELVESIKTEEAEEDLDEEVEVIGDWHEEMDPEMKEDMENGAEMVEEFGTEVLEDDLGKDKDIFAIRDLNEEMNEGIEEEEMEKGEVIEDYESEDPGEALFKEKDDVGLEEWHRDTDEEIQEEVQENEEEMVADMELEDAEEDLDEGKVADVIVEWHRRSDMEIQGEQDDGGVVNNLDYGSEDDLEEEKGEMRIDELPKGIVAELESEEEVVTNLESDDEQEDLKGTDVEVLGGRNRPSDVNSLGELDNEEDVVNNLEGSEEVLEEDNGEVVIEDWHREMDGEMQVEMGYGVVANFQKEAEWHRDTDEEMQEGNEEEMVADVGLEDAGENLEDKDGEVIGELYRESDVDSLGAQDNVGVINSLEVSEEDLEDGRGEVVIRELQGEKDGEMPEELENGEVVEEMESDGADKYLNEDKDIVVVGGSHGDTSKEMQEEQENGKTVNILGTEGEEEDERGVVGLRDWLSEVDWGSRREEQRNGNEFVSGRLTHGVGNLEALTEMQTEYEEQYLDEEVEKDNGGEIFRFGRKWESSDGMHVDVPEVKHEVLGARVFEDAEDGKQVDVAAKELFEDKEMVAVIEGLETVVDEAGYEGTEELREEESEADWDMGKTDQVLRLDETVSEPPELENDVGLNEGWERKGDVPYGKERVGVWERLPTEGVVTEIERKECEGEKEGERSVEVVNAEDAAVYANDLVEDVKEHEMSGDGMEAEGDHGEREEGMREEKIGVDVMEEYENLVHTVQWEGKPEREFELGVEDRQTDTKKKTIDLDNYPEAECLDENEVREMALGTKRLEGRDRIVAEQGLKAELNSKYEGESGGKLDRDLEISENVEVKGNDDVGEVKEYQVVVYEIRDERNISDEEGFSIYAGRERMEEVDDSDLREDARRQEVTWGDGLMDKSVRELKKEHKPDEKAKELDYRERYELENREDGGNAERGAKELEGRGGSEGNGRDADGKQENDEEGASSVDYTEGLDESEENGTFGEETEGRYLSDMQGNLLVKVLN